MKFSIVFSSSAKDDLINLYRYLAQDCAVPLTAQRQIDRILAAINSLEEQPYRCRRFLEGEELLKLTLRTLIINPWQVLFHIDEDSCQIRIVRIMSSRMNITEHL